MKKIIRCFLAIILSILIFTSCNIDSSKIQTKYESDSTEQLIKTCEKYQNENDFESIYKAFPYLIERDDAFTKMKGADFSYELMYTEWIFSLLFLEKYDEFDANFASYYSKLLFNENMKPHYLTFLDANNYYKTDLITEEGYCRMDNQFEILCPLIPQFERNAENQVRLFLENRELKLSLYSVAKTEKEQQALLKEIQNFTKGWMGFLNNSK